VKRPVGKSLVRWFARNRQEIAPEGLGNNESLETELLGGREGESRCRSYCFAIQSLIGFRCVQYFQEVRYLKWGARACLLESKEGHKRVHAIEASLWSDSFAVPEN